MSDDILGLLNKVENEHDIIEEINKLQESFNTIKSTYRNAYTNDLESVLEFFKEKIKQNSVISKTINDYVEKYVKENKEQAKEELFNILSAEMVDTFIALSHTSSCNIS